MKSDNSNRIQTRITKNNSNKFYRKTGQKKKVTLRKDKNRVKMSFFSKTRGQILFDLIIKYIEISNAQIFPSDNFSEKWPKKTFFPVQAAARGKLSESLKSEQSTRIRFHRQIPEKRAVEFKLFSHH